MSPRTFRSLLRLGPGLLILLLMLSCDQSQIALLIDNRTIDGTENNEAKPDWGSAGEHLARLLPAAYEDGIASPAGITRPSAREISNVLSAQDMSTPNDRELSGFVWQWGQFVDHDISFTPFEHDGEEFDIVVPTGDPFFDPESTGLVKIDFYRSNFDTKTGTSQLNQRQQVNVITSWIDASNVYGSDEDRATWLRAGFGGFLKMSDGFLLPFNDGSQPNDPSPSSQFFVAGDIRANEQSALSTMHTLFVREHNRLAAELAVVNPEWTDEELYQRARKFVGAFMQAITFNEFLPALMGPLAPGPYAGYDADADPSIFNEFSAALYRFGHSMLTANLLRLDNFGAEVPEGPLMLRDAFFNPSRIIDEGGINPLLRGLAAQTMEEVDLLVVEDVRSFLFGPPPSPGMDLAAANIQRARDHGIPDYNSVRFALGLSIHQTFAEITSDSDIADDLATLYSSVADIDAWVGALAEAHVPGTSMGELLITILSLQFENLRNSDRFWYENDPSFSAADISNIKNTRLSHIILRNTEIFDVQENVFFVP